MSAQSQGVYQRLAWYHVPTTKHEHLVQLNAEGEAMPTDTQRDLIVYPEHDPHNAGHFWGAPGGNMINLN